MASATNSGRGGNRGPQPDKGGKSGSGPRNGHQSHGADPQRGRPG